MRLTPQEWLTGIQTLTRIGQVCTPARQEFILLSDTLGLSALVNIMHDKTAEAAGTEGSLLGPFYRESAPELELGQSIAQYATGPALVMFGQVTDAHGAPVPHARIEVWQTDSAGEYDLQTYGTERMDMRGNFAADAQGQFHFRTIRPLAYYIPMDGPVGAMVRAQGRHGCRPAHVHFLISAPGQRELVTALYLADDQYIDSDVVFGVSNALVITPREGDPACPVPGVASVRYDFRLAPAGADGTGRVGADPSRTLAAAQ